MTGDRRRQPCGGGHGARRDREGRRVGRRHGSDGRPPVVTSRSTRSPSCDGPRVRGARGVSACRSWCAGRAGPSRRAPFRPACRGWGTAARGGSPSRSISRAPPLLRARGVRPAPRWCTGGLAEMLSGRTSGMLC